MITSAIIFDHSGRAWKQKPGPVEVRVTVDRKAYYFKTGVAVLRGEFMAGTIVSRYDAEVLNDRVRLIHAKVLAEVNECIRNGTQMDIEAIRRRVWSVAAANRESAFLDWIKEQLPLLGHREGTMKHYDTLLMRLEQFKLMSRWADVTVENIYRWDAWLHDLQGWDGKKISDGAVYNYHKCLKALLSRAIRSGVITANPYDKLRGAFKRGDRETVEYLTEEEMHRIEGLKLEPGSVIEKARDLFVFQMYTGLSYGDMLAFDFDDYRLEDGMWTNVGQRVKTGVPYISRLLPPAVKVLEKYGWRLPVLDNSDYNRNLKGLGVAAGIQAPLHSHMARHTFATWMLSQGVSLDSVSVMVGHTNVVQTRRYAKTIAKTVRDDFDKIAEQMKNRPILTD